MRASVCPLLTDEPGFTGIITDASSAALGTVPSSITPSQKARATLSLTPSGSAPSGLPFQVTFTESLDIREGTATSTQHYSPYTQDLFAYQNGSDLSKMSASFPVSPFPGIDVVTLLTGRIDLAAGAYDATPQGGGIFDPQGSQAMQVDGGGGTHATLPAHASSSAVPVRIFPVLQSSLLAPIPQGFTFLGGIELNLGGGSLVLPATLGLDLTSLAAPLQPADQVVVVKAATVAGVATYAATDLGGINTATDRLETGSAGSPWPMVTGEGRYVFLKANAPIGFVTGKVLDPQSQAIPGAAVGLLGALFNATVPAGSRALPASSSLSFQGLPAKGTASSPSFRGIPPAGSPGGISNNVPAGTSSETLPGQSLEGTLGVTGNKGNSSSPSFRGLPAKGSPEGISNRRDALRARIYSLVKAGKAPEAALALVDLSGITSLSATDGAYIVPAPLSSVTVKAVDLLTADTGEAQAAPTQTTPVAEKDVVIHPSPITVVSTSPADGATGVPVGSSVIVTFSKLVAPASLTSTTFQVGQTFQSVGQTFLSGGLAPVSGSLSVILGGKTVVFMPDSPWTPGAQVTVTLAGITDRLGQAAPTGTFHFTAVNPPLVRLDPGAIEARLPDASGAICVEGGPGAADGLATVYIVNTSHPEVTVTVTSNPNGSFTACLPGAVGDILEVHALSQAGGEQVYTISRMISADHTTVSMGPGGGTFTAPLPDGTSVTLQVPQGAFDGPATLSVHPAAPAQAAPVPAGFAAGAPVNIELSQTAKKEIALVLHAPSDWNLTDPTKQFWLVQTVTWGPNATQSPMVLDTLRPTPCPGDTSGQCLITQSPPFQGLRESAVLQLYEADASYGWAQGRLSLEDLVDRVVIQADGSAFVCLLQIAAFGDLWVLPTDPSASQVKVSFKDAASGEVILEVTRTGPPAPGSMLDFGITTNVITRPFLTDAAPFAAKPFQLKAAPAPSSDPLVSFEVSFGSSPNVRIKAPAGTAAPGTSGTPLYAQISVAGCNPSLATIMPDGSFDATLDHLTPGANTGDLRPSLTSGQPVTVTYTPFLGAGSATATLASVPEQPVTDKLALTILQGKLRLKASAKFGPNLGMFTLYTAMAGKASMALTTGTALEAGGSVDLDLSTQGLAVGDVLFYTLEQDDIDQTSSITATFDRSLMKEPVAVTEANKTGFDENQPSVRLVVVDDPDLAMPLSAESLVDMTLAFAPSTTSPREIRVMPRENLKPGVAYELRFKNLQNDAGLAMPAGGMISGRFRVYGGSVVGQTHYDDIYDVVRRGSVLYEALGDQGIDILDVSDPTDPQSLVGGPQAMLGRTRGVAIGQNVQVPEGGQDPSRTVAAFVGGGDAGHNGFIEVRYADFADDPAHPEQNPPQTAPMGQHISGAFLCHSVGSGLEGPQGSPTLVKTVGATAFVATTGVGLQVVDLSAVAHQNRYAVQASVGTYKVSDTETMDISMALGGIGVLPPQANSSGFVLAAVRNKGLVAYDVTSGPGLKEAGYAKYPASVRPTGAVRLNVYPSYTYTVSENGALATKTTNLLLMAGGSAGLMVYEVVANGTAVTATLKTVVPMPVISGVPITVYDVALDVRRHVAYLACYNSGVCMVDMANPYAGADRPTPYAILDADGNLRDDRILGFLNTSPGSRSTLVVDSDTGLVYVGEQGTDSGLKVVGAQQPRMTFLLDDPAHPGQFKEPGYLSAFDGDKPRVGLWLPGKAGTWDDGTKRQQIQTSLDLYDRAGLHETPATDANGNPVSTTVTRPSVTLVRQSDRKTDAKYNFFLQDAAQPVTLGMIYDPATPDSTLMVSKQSGSLKGVATGIQWHAITQHWGTTPSVTRTVSRPWVEWVYVRPESPSANRESLGASIPESSDFWVSPDKLYSASGVKTKLGIVVHSKEPSNGETVAVTLDQPQGDSLTPASFQLTQGKTETQKELMILANNPRWAKINFSISDKTFGTTPIAVLLTRARIWNGGAELGNGNANPVQGDEVPTADRSAVGAYLLVNWDDDDGIGQIDPSQSGPATWSKAPAPDLTRNLVVNEDNLAQYRPGLTPLPDEGTAIVWISGPDSDKIKLWQQSSKGREIPFSAMPTGKQYVWNLSDPLQKADFRLLVANGMWIEGIASSTSERGVLVTCTYKDTRGNIICADKATATVVMLHLGNIVGRELDIPLQLYMGHVGIVGRYTGKCIRGDLVNPENYMLFQSMMGNGGPTMGPLTGITQLGTREFFGVLHPFLTSYSNADLLSDSINGYVYRLKVLGVAHWFVDNGSHIGYSLPNPMNYLQAARWDNTLNGIHSLRCDGFVEVSCEINNIPLWGQIVEGRPQYLIEVNYDGHHLQYVHKPGVDLFQEPRLSPRSSWATLIPTTQIGFADTYLRGHPGDFELPWPDSNDFDWPNQTLKGRFWDTKAVSEGLVAPVLP